MALRIWQIADSVINKGKSAIPALVNGPEVLSSASDKAQVFAKNFSKNPNLDDSSISLTVFPCGEFPIQGFRVQKFITFHHSKVDKTITRNFWELNGKN